MTDIAFLGLGAMGSRMAGRLLDAGHALTVWNRSAEACEPLAARGARVAHSPRAAVAGAELAIAMVRDDEASRAVWLDGATGALAGLEEGATVVESSTITPAWARELGAAVAAAGRAFVEGPVSGSTPQAESGELIYLAGGAAEAIDAVEPVLLAMGSAVRRPGGVGAGALAKLATNTLMAVQVTTLAELAGAIARDGGDPAAILAAVATTAVWSGTAARVTPPMLAGTFAPQFPVELIEKDLGYQMRVAHGHAPTIEATRGVFRDALERGYGSENMTAVARLFR